MPTQPDFLDCEYRDGGPDCFSCSNPRLTVLKCLTPEMCQRCVSAAMNRPADAPDPSRPKGPGTHLRLLLGRLGFDSEYKGCQCKNRAAKMDRKGNDWCRRNLNTILLWLKREAKKRKLPFSKAIAKQIVLIAIRRSEREGYRPKQ